MTSRVEALTLSSRHSGALEPHLLSRVREHDRRFPGLMFQPAADAEAISLLTIAREWTRLGCTGFGGPPTHISMLRQLCVIDRRWLSATDFEDGIAATRLLPGPASTQLAIFCGWRLRGTVGALVAGV